MGKSASASSSLSSASSLASKSLSSGSKTASSAASSASAKASAVAGDAYNQTAGFSTTTTVLTTTAVVLTLLAVVTAGVYYSGYADDFFMYWAKRVYKAKAKAEMTALGATSSEQAQGFLKDQLKKNPVMGEDELEQVSSGLGREASMEGLGSVSNRLGGLGKF